MSKHRVPCRDEDAAGLKDGGVRDLCSRHVSSWDDLSRWLDVHYVVHLLCDHTRLQSPHSGAPRRLLDVSFLVAVMSNEESHFLDLVSCARIPASVFADAPPPARRVHERCPRLHRIHLRFHRPTLCQRRRLCKATRARWLASYTGEAAFNSTTAPTFSHRWLVPREGARLDIKESRSHCGYSGFRRNRRTAAMAREAEVQSQAESTTRKQWSEERSGYHRRSSQLAYNAIAIA